MGEVSRKILESIVEGAYTRFLTAEEVEELRAALAEQHQGEPGAWRFQTHAGGRWYLTHFEANVRAYEGNGEGSAVQALTPLTAADPGEVERLHSRLREEQAYVSELAEQNTTLEKERDSLRAQLEAEKKQHRQVLELATRRWYVIAKKEAQLAERDALLRELADDVLFVAPSYRQKAEAILSASAEPSAPVERDERATYEAWAKEQGLSVTRTPQALCFHNGTRRAAGDYLDLSSLCSYAAWQARAALERKP